MNRPAILREQVGAMHSHGGTIEWRVSESSLTSKDLILGSIGI
jgi:hypothetical protein